MHQQVKHNDDERHINSRGYGGIASVIKSALIILGNEDHYLGIKEAILNIGLKSDKKISDALYLKVMEVAKLQLIIAGMCVMIYGYNIIRFKNHRLTKKMVFFSFILFPAIIDNIYDYVTGGDVSKFDTESIVALLIIMIVYALISILYTALYTYNAYIGGKEIAYKPLSQDDEEETGIQILEARLFERESADFRLVGRS